jgi:pimeloyl-ACP methyl ester carboxylesterase
MVLKTSRWGDPGSPAVLCVHGLAQRGIVFTAVAERLAALGHSVVAVDLRGHGDSGREPPWNTDAHVGDLLDTLDSLGIESATWIGHSFGGRLAAAVAARHLERVERLVLLEPGLDVDPRYALRSAEVERLDWSFAGVEGALNALLSNDAMVAPPRETLARYVAMDLRRGPDGRHRFSFSPSAVVVAWNELSLPPPPIAPVPTLLVAAEVPLGDRVAEADRYREKLGDLLVTATVPHGHNVLWESPAETGAAIEAFLVAGEGEAALAAKPGLTR